VIHQLPLLLAVVSAPLFQDVGERRVASGPAARAGGYSEPTTTVVYDVHDIVSAEVRIGSLSDSTAWRLLEDKLAQDATGAPAEARERARDEAAQRLQRSLTAWLQVSVGWDSELHRLQRPGPAALILQGTAAQHAWTRAFLERQRGAEGAFVDIEARWVDAPLGTFASLGLASTVLTDGEALAAFFKVLEDLPDVELHDPLRLVVANRGDGELQDVNQVAYVKEWRLVVVEPGDQEIADPVIDTFQEGEVVKFAPALLPDGRVGLEVELTSSEVERPIETRSMRLSPLHDNEVEYSVPIVSRRTIEARVSLAPGAAFVIPTIGQRPDREMLLVLTARVLEMEFFDPDTITLEAPAEPPGRRR
jgi:hypothetical protein